MLSHNSLRTLLAALAALIGLLLAVPIVVLALPFWTVAFLTRALARRLEPSYVSWDQLMEFTPVIGWKPKANLNAHYLTLAEDGVFHIVTDAQGWPGTMSIAQSDIVVFGDSYAFGYGVNVEASFAECHHEVRIKAIGAPGYNMAQEVLLMRQLSPQLVGKLVVWFIFLGNDLYDNLTPNMYRYRMPFVREVNETGSWQLVTSHVSPAQWPYTSARFRDFTLWDRILADTHSPTPLSQRAFSACEFLIGKGHDICSRAGARLLVMTIPDPLTVSQRGLQRLFSRGADPNTFDPDLPDKNIGEICTKFGVLFVAGRNHLDARHYKTRDPHWNERGHQQVASLLKTLYYDCIIGGGGHAREI
jgi:hypothetical protein